MTYKKPFSIIDQAIQKATTPQEKWDLSCTKKLSSETTVYKTGKELGEVLMTLPAGTYIKISDTAKTWQTIDFMVDGEKYHGLMALGGVDDATVQVTGTGGLPDSVHELDPRYKSLTGGSVKLSSGETGNSDEAAQAGESDGTAVSLVELGSVTSKVSYQGKTVEVATAELEFAKDVPESQKVAVIYAPRTGKVSMRAKASESAKVIKKCKAGIVVSVLKTGKQFTLINCGGKVGYVLTDCLQFANPSDETLGLALISYKSKTTGSTTANIRNKPDKSSARVAEWKTGTEVVILSYKDGWYEVEANGIRGFVLEAFVTKTE
ncbi:MAG: SH3 domain-containing protein [Eubacteriales bacterium]|nr:SH3 domain-containing protein [Eubacteriales bacterium]MDD3881850.1 SH3 domain-containing protein [Eubacteriales bacterium]MDD4512904.1 SH3 domain-containing protein [Eubacteriales bacterium]